MFVLLDFGWTIAARAALAFGVSLVLSLIFGAPLINYLHRHQHNGQPIREDGPQSHLQTKKGTPTMGGLLILGTSILSVLLFCNLKYHFVWVCLLILIMYGATGFVDDYWKVKKQTSNAMTARMKLFFQFLTALVAASIITSATPRGINTVLALPSVKNIVILFFILGIPLIFISAVMLKTALNKGKRFLFAAIMLPMMLFVLIMGLVIAYKATHLGQNFDFWSMLKEDHLNLTYLRRMVLNLSWLYIPFAVVVISGASNAVNLSDGLDGLASGLLIMAFAFFGVVAYFCSLNHAVDFNLFYIPRSGEVAVVCAALVGSCLGFLYFNKPKARVFMGDTGSLALGAVLGAIAIMTKSEIILAVVGGVFVAETLSVMIQVLYFKKTGKRFFKMAPIHHHFEQLGWSEKKVVFSFWLTALFLVGLGILLLF